jgi:hypothetical protein
MEAGGHNACPGIIMWQIHSACGRNILPGIFAGIAEDQAQVINTNSTVTVPYGTFTTLC